MYKTPTRFRLAPRVGRSIPTEYFVLANLQAEGAVIGHVGDQPIRETVIDGNGLRYHFAGVALRDADGRLDVESLRPGEWIVKPGLVYLMEGGGYRKEG
jgi:hypothetical protein